MKKGLSRRDFLQASGALVVSFSAAAIIEPFAAAQGPFDTHPSHVDPLKLDSWLAVASDGSVTAYTGKCDLGQGMYTVADAVGGRGAVRGARPRETDPVRHVRNAGSGNNVRQPVDTNEFQRAKSRAGGGNGARSPHRNGGGATGRADGSAYAGGWRC